MTNFSTVKVRSDFLAWLRREGARRGIFLYELLEETAARSLAGKKPWQDARPTPSDPSHPESYWTDTTKQ